MGFIELFILAVGLSMDAFAVAVCAGLTMARASVKKALTVGLYFGAFQAGMPLIGYFVGGMFGERIIAYSHWIAFALLGFLGGKMIADGFRGARPGTKEQSEQSLKLAKMLPLAIATSIDALAVGVSFALLQVRIVPAVSMIGIITLIISAAGVKIGNIFGARFKSKAQFAGGIILILIGTKILLEYLQIINF